MVFQELVFFKQSNHLLISLALRHNYHLLAASLQKIVASSRGCRSWRDGSVVKALAAPREEPGMLRIHARMQAKR